MSGLTRAQLQAELTSSTRKHAAELTRLKTEFERAKEAWLQDSEKIEKRRDSALREAKELTGENNDLRDRLHQAELRIAHMRGKLSLLDEPPPAPAPAPRPGRNR